MSFSNSIVTYVKGWVTNSLVIFLKVFQVYLFFVANKDKKGAKSAFFNETLTGLCNVVRLLRGIVAWADRINRGDVDAIKGIHDGTIFAAHLNLTFFR